MSSEKRSKKKKRKRRGVDRHTAVESSYLCDSCGEEIVVPIDVSAGSDQEYVEDCPVCCHPNLVSVSIEEDGEIRCWAQSE